MFKEDYRLLDVVALAYKDPHKFSPRPVPPPPTGIFQNVKYQLLAN